MRVLWDAIKPLTVTEIRKTLCEKTGWEDSTAKTLLYRLQKKGVVSQMKKEVFYYSPCVTEREYNEYSATTLVDKLFHGSAKSLVATLVSSKSLSREDIEELQNMFRENQNE